MGKIVTVTINPVIDKSTQVAGIAPEKKLRCEQPRFEPGGGGINVARAIKKLGGDALAIYTSGGYTGRFLNDLLKEEGKRFPTTGDLKQNVFAISPSAEIRIWLGKETVSLTAVVPTGLNKSTKDSVALGIYRSLEEKVEFRQGEAGEWFTYFSFEDLTSDQIGFYLAHKYGKIVNPAKEGLEKNEIAWRDLSNICGFPENRQQAILRSQQAYNSMNASGPGSLWGDPFMRLLVNTPHIFTWGTPLLCELSGICDDQPKRWPAELNAAMPTQPMRNGLWWFYDQNLDGDLVSITNNPQFHYLKK